MDVFIFCVLVLIGTMFVPGAGKFALTCVGVAYTVLSAALKFYTLLH